MYKGGMIIWGWTGGELKRGEWLKWGEKLDTAGFMAERLLQYTTELTTVFVLKSMYIAKLRVREKL